MSGPTSNEVAEAPVDAEVPNTVEDAVESVPDTSDNSVEQLSFMDAIDSAFNEKIETPQEPTPVAEVEEAEPEVVPIEEVLGEDFQQEESSEEQDTDENDPTDVLSEDLGDDWTPKAASRFKQLKTELKQTSTELHQLRQQKEEY